MLHQLQTPQKGFKYVIAWFASFSYLDGVWKPYIDMYDKWKWYKNSGVEMSVSGNNPWKGKHVQIDGCSTFIRTLINGWIRCLLKRKET
jgi:hypothetical protein